MKFLPQLACDHNLQQSILSGIKRPQFSGLLPHTTTNVEYPVMFVDGSAAIMVVVPAVTVSARPCEPAVLLIVETRVFDELRVTADVRSVIKSPE